MEKHPSPLSVDHLLIENRKFSPLEGFSSEAHVKSLDVYEDMYKRSIDDSHAFWIEQSKSLNWFKKPAISCNYTWDSKDSCISHKWFEDGIINVSFNCLDRHLETETKDKTAILWQGEDDSETRSITYQELYEEVCRFANVLKASGIEKGDRVSIYLPMIPETVIAMLACARIGAIHSVVFGGFSAESLSHRMNDSTCKLLITADGAMRGGKIIPLKDIADAALKNTPSVERAIVVKRLDGLCKMLPGRDVWYSEQMNLQSPACAAEPLNSCDPLFILYTSGSTGKPKGVVHGQGGYLLHASLSHKYIFDTKESDIYWCTADAGWITGHSYVVYGPLANGATTLLFEGTPSYPDSGRFWQVVEKHKVSVFYTAPTVIRSLISSGIAIPNKYDLSSLRLLGTVGEPINPEAWMWYHTVIGKGKTPIVDTWWQTETGGIMIAPLPGCHTLKPGSASRPFFGVDPIILRDDGSISSPDEGGSLCIRKPWPGIMMTTWNDHSRFVLNYFKTFNNVYFSGDGCRVDKDGDYWLLGRIDDVVNVSGHRIGTAEVESAIVSHEAVSEAAVVPMPHDIKGQGLYAFVSLVDDVSPSKELDQEIRLHVREQIGPIAVPDKIRFTKALPKTRSGKIMRRILRKIAENQFEELGDISTLADIHVVKSLMEE